MVIGDSGYKGQIGWDRIISLDCSLDKPVIRDSHFRCKGQFGTKYVKDVRQLSYSHSCMPFIPSKIGLYFCNNFTYA